MYKLYSMPSFIFGVARTLDLFGLFDEYNISRSPKEADSKSIGSDWEAIGKDFKEAIINYKSKIQSEVHVQQK